MPSQVKQSIQNLEVPEVHQKVQVAYSRIDAGLPKDQELIEALEAAEVRRNFAAIIVYLKNPDEAASRDIEKGSGLRQPEVSIAMRVLREKGWIAEREVKREGKGRPMKLYRLTVSLDEIIGHYEEKKRFESSRAMQSIQRLKEISAT